MGRPHLKRAYLRHHSINKPERVTPQLFQMCSDVLVCFQTSWRLLLSSLKNNCPFCPLPRLPSNYFRNSWLIFFCWQCREADCVVETNCFVFRTERGKKKPSNSTRSPECIIHQTGENNLSLRKRFDVKYNETAVSLMRLREGDWFNIEEDAMKWSGASEVGRLCWRRVKKTRTRHTVRCIEWGQNSVLSSLRCILWTIRQRKTIPH